MIIIIRVTVQQGRSNLEKLLSKREHLLHTKELSSTKPYFSESKMYDVKFKDGGSSIVRHF